MLSMFDNVNEGTLILVVLAGIVGVYLFYLEKREQKAKEDACNRYVVLTAEQVDALPDEELVRAVVANVVKKQESQKADLSVLLPFLSPGRRGVYGVWLLENELARRDLATFFRSPYRRFAPVMAEGFAMLGASTCATVWDEVCARYEAQKNGEKGLASWDEYTARLRDALKDEEPLSLCVAYIRDNVAEFVD